MSLPYWKVSSPYATTACVTIRLPHLQSSHWSLGSVDPTLARPWILKQFSRVQALCRSSPICCTHFQYSPLQPPMCLAWRHLSTSWTRGKVYWAFYPRYSPHFFRYGALGAHKEQIRLASGYPPKCRWTWWGLQRFAFVFFFHSKVGLHVLRDKRSHFTQQTPANKNLLF